MQQWDFDEIISGAENGNPHLMLKLAKLYKAGALEDPYCSRYIYWLNRFINVPVVQEMMEELEGKYSQKDNDHIENDYSILDIIDPHDYMVLREDIIEAGLALGIYYCNSCKKEELELSVSCLVAALDASAWDNLEYQTTEGNRDIRLLLNRVSDRLKKLEVKRNEE